LRDKGNDKLRVRSLNLIGKTEFQLQISYFLNSTRSKR